MPQPLDHKKKESIETPVTLTNFHSRDYCETSLPNFFSDFVHVFLDHMLLLMVDAEQGNTNKSQWVKSEAAKASNMKKSETLRFECPSRFLLFPGIKCFVFINPHAGFCLPTRYE